MKKDTYDLLEEFQNVVNKIDDFLEYRYKSYTKEEVRDAILLMISEMDFESSN